MAVNSSTIDYAIDLIAGIEGLAMDPDDLADDVVFMSIAWPDERDFMLAASATERAMRQLIAGQVNATPLLHNLSGRFSYHYQHVRKQGQRANMRIVFKPHPSGIRVRTFGHRDIPADIYERTALQR